MKRALAVLFFAVFAGAYAVSAEATLLNPAGNAEAARIFERYRQAPAVCDPSLPGKHILLTGFGLFQDIKLNSSAVLAANIADPAIWPETLQPNEHVRLNPGLTLHDGLYPVGRGATAISRALQIGGQPINLCILVLDTLWDSAGAIVTFEMNRFQPEAVLMLGGGGGPILEGGALNSTSQINGYNSDGKANNDNLPVKKYNLPGARAGHERTMTWDNQLLAAQLEPLMSDTKKKLRPVKRARHSNTYLCNHVSYVALTAAQNLPIELAGGLIRIQPDIRSNPQIGFFHLPWKLPLAAKTVEDWGSIVSSLLYFMVQN